MICTYGSLRGYCCETCPISSGNYLLPVHIGAPDYFNYLKKLFPLFVITPIICLKTTAGGAVALNNNSFPDLSSSYSQENYDSDYPKENSSYNTSSKHDSIGSYLAGLLEGDGHIILSKSIDCRRPLAAELRSAAATFAAGQQPKGLKDSKVKNTATYIAITFVNKDLPLINKLKQKFGGRLRFKDKENAIVWIIGTHKELVNMINLLNGYLRTPKIIKFNQLIIWLNNKYNYNIPINSPDTSDLNANGWLAGFIDADGGFKVRYTEKLISENTSKVLRKGRIEVKFALEQRKNLNGDFINVDNNIYSYEAIMLQIYSFFGISTNLKLSKHNVDKTYFIVEVSSLIKLNILIQYLKKYPLLTAKRNDYEDWVKIFYLILDKKHLTDEGKLLIKQIKYNMNKNRVVFYWDHLSYLNKVQ